MKGLLLFATVFIVMEVASQPVRQRLETAWQQFSKDSQLRHAISGLAVRDVKTGAVIFEKNAQVGLAPASTQKVLTSIAAFEMLGSGFRYKTALAVTGRMAGGWLDGELRIIVSGDPTLGSWRWQFTKDSVLLNQWISIIKRAGISKIKKLVWTDSGRFSRHIIPDGWIWQDLGNYYGAGAGSFNWRENQSDLVLNSGAAIGSVVTVANSTKFEVELKAAAANSGDNAYGYLPIDSSRPLLKGTIPINQKNFTISLSDPQPAATAFADLIHLFSRNGITVESFDKENAIYEREPTLKILHTHYSPPFDSMNYYFLRRSINLYGEAFVKTLAINGGSPGDTETGTELVRQFFTANGIERSAIRVIDGSGLSPQNRVTADALVRALIFARSRSWYSSFYHALPEYNGMKMKSGSINGVRSFAGYHRSTDGKEYAFSLIVNNFDGPATEIIKKMYKLLNVLK